MLENTLFNGFKNICKVLILILLISIALILTSLMSDNTENISSLKSTLGGGAAGGEVTASTSDIGGASDKVTGGTNDTSLHIFRRDLRIVDNTALDLASKESNCIIPVFIFDDKQVGDSNKFKSDASINFMVNSLNELSDAIRGEGGELYFMFAKDGKTPADIVEEIIKKTKINGVYFNSDYTPYSKKRDSEIAAVCKKHGVSVTSPHDVLILDDVKTAESSGENYKVFTPFHRAFEKEKIRKPSSGKHKWIKTDKLNTTTPIDLIGKYINNKLKPVVSGGRKEGLKILKGISVWDKYNENRNILSYETTRLSAHNKFGTVSCREVYYAFGQLKKTGNDLTKQMYWRDFYYNLMNNDPRALKGNFNSKFDKYIWGNNPKYFKAWCEGKTGYPIIDACMRELNATNYMHNRGRMIVADFLIKLLNVDWRKGEKYFAQQLVGYDPAQNNYNWQWVAGTGPFSQPYFRVFNPWTQAKKFDPKCDYIKKWCPELNDIAVSDLINWDTKYHKYLDGSIDYPEPIIDYETARALYAKTLPK